MKAQIKHRQVQLKWETGYHATLKTAKKGLCIHLEVNICHARKKKKKIYYFTFRSGRVLLYLISHSTSGSQIKLVKTGCCEVAV